MADIIFWILFGFLAGWIVTLTTRHDSHRIKVNISVGVLGAIAGGALSRPFLSTGGQSIGFSLQSLLAAVCGAIILLTVAWTLKKQG